jgi:Cdc6-like AAA superfamily ATPase
MAESKTPQVKALAFDHDIKRLIEGFIGREWVFEEINRWLQQDNKRFFILTGEPGVGKSAIVAHLIQTRTGIVAQHFCQLGVEETVNPSRVLRSLAAQLDLNSLFRKSKTAKSNLNRLARDAYTGSYGKLEFRSI